MEEIPSIADQLSTRGERLAAFYCEIVQFNVWHLIERKEVNGRARQFTRKFAVLKLKRES